MLLGADVYFDLVTYGLIKLGPNLPIIQNTHLGYIVGGNIPYSRYTMLGSNATPSTNNAHSHYSNISLHVQTADLDSLLKNFWEIEETKPLTSIHVKTLTSSEQRAEDIFKSSLTILPSGRFQVDLPLKTPNEYQKLGESFHLAKRRFFNLEKRLNKSDELRHLYTEFISEYVSLGHCKYVPLSKLNESSEHKFFLPHHCVFKHDSLTTRLRIVFDGSMKSTSNVSLNDIMLKGYTVQPDLFEILIRFRLYKYTLIADIEKMFRQIRINPKQTFLLNILWRNSPQEELKCLELQTVTYGTNIASFLSTRCLKELAVRNKEKYPLAADALENSCYVDDILHGANDIETLYKTYKQLSTSLNSAGIPLHKWSSNSSEFLDSISSESQKSNYVIKPDNSSNKVLGICWNSQSDMFSISLPDISSEPKYTKREVLSIISSIFDPLGLINPITVSAKLLMQKIWICNLNWDDKLTGEISSEWLNFLAHIPDLAKLPISRPLLNPLNISRIEIHGFYDASMKAYGACIYLRVLHENGIVSCNLITSKSRVAPLKTISLPRLELLGAVLLSTLISNIFLIISPKVSSIASVRLWTDSQIVLAWINSHPSRWSIFVANRITQIQELTRTYLWSHVSSKDNPADILSRGTTPALLVDNTLWWHGPHFLMNATTKFNEFVPNIDITDIPEIKATLHAVNNSKPTLYTTFCKFSSFTRLQRVIAYCNRYIYNLKNKENKRNGVLSASELIEAEQRIVKIIQLTFFQSEFKDLKHQKTIKNKAILKLNPFIDASDLIRVGGRLRNANVSYNQKFPLLLPTKCQVVRSLLEREHIRLLHTGPQNTLSNIRLTYWPLDGLREIKRIIYKCKNCYRFNARPAHQIMADLPKERFQVSRPFTNVGIDYGGPFQIKSSKLRRAPICKAYIAVFVCLVTKTVHIELVSSLSTEAFLLTLKRFISRRGIPKTIYSDNASNFLGARNQLKELYDFFMGTDVLPTIKEFAASTLINWKFIAPRSPHQGGIWEAAIKSCKYHLVRMMGNNIFTFEELTTILAPIEAVLNSRPLCPLSDSPNDFSFLTPAHFLIGSSMTSYPEKDISTKSENSLSLWQKCSKIQQHFWKCWSRDYLNRLQNKPKWFLPQENIKVDDLVLLIDDNAPPLKWPLARVIETLPSKDGRVRTAKLRTKDGIFIRSVVKVCPLPHTHLDVGHINGGTMLRNNNT
ncbi:uncharacterized protein [Diabrotica undecimpunctata]|uniref:uncharacterized protein n=1 Tax=Diabrotica undecimpunctata TaxID=50387 RepID=UPI003B642208